MSPYNQIELSNDGINVTTTTAQKTAERITKRWNVARSCNDGVEDSLSWLCPSLFDHLDHTTPQFEKMTQLWAVGSDTLTPGGHFEAMDASCSFSSPPSHSVSEEDHNDGLPFDSSSISDLHTPLTLLAAASWRVFAFAFPMLVVTFAFSA